MLPVVRVFVRTGMGCFCSPNLYVLITEGDGNITQDLWGVIWPRGRGLPQ